MKIVMLLDKDYIDAIDIERSSMTLPGYVGRFVRLLKNKHKKLLAVVNTEPEFLFIDHGTLQSYAAQPNNTPHLQRNPPVRPGPETIH